MNDKDTGLWKKWSGVQVVVQAASNSYPLNMPDPRGRGFKFWCRQQAVVTHETCQI